MHKHQVITEDERYFVAIQKLIREARFTDLFDRKPNCRPGEAEFIVFAPDGKPVVSLPVSDCYSRWAADLIVTACRGLVGDLPGEDVLAPTEGV